MILLLNSTASLDQNLKFLAHYFRSSKCRIFSIFLFHYNIYEHSTLILFQLAMSIQGFYFIVVLTYTKMSHAFFVRFAILL